MSRLAPLAIALGLSLAVPAALAQDTAQDTPAEPDGDAPAKSDSLKEGTSLIEEGAKLLLRGLGEEIEPLMKDLTAEMEPKVRAFAEDLAPMLEEFSNLVGDLDMYHPPEKLPNGDIILRRKKPLDVPPAEGDEVEL